MEQHSVKSKNSKKSYATLIGKICSLTHVDTELTLARNLSHIWQMHSDALPV